MTRGYVCIVNGKNVEKVAYLSGSAYLSWYGIRILDSVRRNGLSNYIDNERKDNIAAYGNKDDPCKGFALNWIKPDKESKAYSDWNYAEYGYIYNQRTEALSVYNRGERLFAIKPEDRDRFAFIFENSSALESVLSYDADKLTYNWKRQIKKCADMPLEELQKLVKKAEEERIELDDMHCMASGFAPGREKYEKHLTSSTKDICLTFLAEHDHLITDHGWEVLLQTPYCRFRFLNKTFRSEKAAMKALREEIKANSEGLFRLAEIFGEYEEAKNNGTLKDFAETLDAEWKMQPWIYRAYVTPEYIKIHI